MNPRFPNKSDSDKQREAIAEMLSDLRRSFDKLTIRLVGVEYNGEERVIDSSGGELGRMGTRVRTLEAGFKIQIKALIGMGVLLLLNGGVTNAKTILEFLEKALK